MNSTYKYACGCSSTGYDLPARCPDHGYPAAWADAAPNVDEALRLAGVLEDDPTEEDLP